MRKDIYERMKIMKQDDIKPYFRFSKIWYITKEEPINEGNYWHYVDGISTIFVLIMEFMSKIHDKTTKVFVNIV